MNRVVRTFFGAPIRRQRFPMIYARAPVYTLCGDGGGCRGRIEMKSPSRRRFLLFPVFLFIYFSSFLTAPTLFPRPVVVFVRSLCVSLSLSPQPPRGNQDDG